MKQLGLGVLTATLLMWQPARADESLHEMVRESAGAATLLSRCQGYWTWVAALQDSTGKAATAEFLRGYANGAQIGALWLHAAKYQVDNPERPARPLGDFSFLVDGPAETEANRLAALLEHGDATALKEMGDLCTATLPMVENIANILRAQVIEDLDQDD